MTDTFKRTLKSSIVLHIVVITVFLVFPVLTRCVKRNKNEDIPPDLIIPILPSAPVPQIPQPAPEPPKPEPPLPEPPKPEPEPKPEIAEPPKKKEIKVNTNRVVRKEQPPPPKPAPIIKVEDLKDSILKDLPTLPPGVASSSGNPTEMGIYHGKVYSILYRAWDQPPGVSGLRVQTTIRIARNGAILNNKVRSRSGSPLMDQSVQRALDSVTTLPPLPASIKGPYYDLEVNFSTMDGSM